MEHVDRCPGLQSYFTTQTTSAKPNTNPFVGLLQLVKDQRLTADYLVCCGDITNRAEPEGLTRGWKSLNDLAQQLQARQLLVTAGNHDLDSRLQRTPFDIRHLINTLEPAFPLPSDQLRNKFWADNYVFVRDGRVRFLLINTSAFHAVAKAGEAPERERGRVSPHTIAGIQTELQEDTENYDLNILVCHHHPMRLGEPGDTDASEIEGGDVLLAALAKSTQGRWLVLHGHKHFPKVLYAPGGSRAPIVFSVGSFAAHIGPVLSGRVRNQFYLLEFNVADARNLGSDIAGTFRAWDWIYGKGWEDAGARSGLPSTGGFGHQAAVPVLAAELAARIKQAKVPYETWQDLCAAMASLQYLIPDDVEQLFGELRIRHGVSVLVADPMAASQFRAKTA